MIHLDASFRWKGCRDRPAFALWFCDSSTAHCLVRERPISRVSLDPPHSHPAIGVWLYCRAPGGEKKRGVFLAGSSTYAARAKQPATLEASHSYTIIIAEPNTGAPLCEVVVTPSAGVRIPVVGDFRITETIRVNALIDSIVSRQRGTHDTPALSWVAGRNGAFYETPLSSASFIAAVALAASTRLADDDALVLERLVDVERLLRVPPRYLKNVEGTRTRRPVDEQEIERLTRFVHAMQIVSLTSAYVRDYQATTRVFHRGKGWTCPITGGKKRVGDVWSTMPRFDERYRYRASGDCEDKSIAFFANFHRYARHWGINSDDWVPLLVNGTLQEDDEGHAWCVVVHREDIEHKTSGAAKPLDGGLRYFHVECVQPVHVWPYSRQLEWRRYGFRTLHDMSRREGSAPATYQRVWVLTGAVKGRIKQWIVTRAKVAKGSDDVYLTSWDIFTRGDGHWQTVIDEELHSAYHKKIGGLLPHTDTEFMDMASARTFDFNQELDLIAGGRQGFFTFVNSTLETKARREAVVMLSRCYARTITFHDTT